MKSITYKNILIIICFLGILSNLFFGLSKIYSNFTSDSLFVYDSLRFFFKYFTIKGISFGPNPSLHEMIFNSLFYLISKNFFIFQILSNLSLFILFFL